MIAYSVLMFVIAALFFGIAVSISRGNINLIHSYHWKHVKEVDQKAYGKSFSKGLFVLAASLILSARCDDFTGRFAGSHDNRLHRSCKDANEI